MNNRKNDKNIIIDNNGKLDVISSIRNNVMSNNCRVIKITEIPVSLNMDSVRKKTNDDYSLIWHEHCCECWKTINIYTDDIAYYDEESINWLCKDCYKEKYQKR